MIRIMLVEDNPGMQETLKCLLSGHFAEAEIYVAATLEEAEQLAAAVDPQLIFMDINLPDGNGLHLARKLRAVHGDIPIAFLSNTDTPEYREAAKNVGGSHYLDKSQVSEQEILAVVQGLLDGGTLH